MYKKEEISDLRLRAPHDFVVGGIYYIQNETNPETFLITLCEGIADKDRIKGRYLTNFDGSFVLAKEASTPYITKRPSRLATDEETSWYFACLAADKVVPRKKVIERFKPDQKTYAITEEQLKFIFENSGLRMRNMLEEWYDPEMFKQQIVRI